MKILCNKIPCICMEMCDISDYESAETTTSYDVVAVITYSCRRIVDISNIGTAVLVQNTAVVYLSTKI